MSDKKEKTVREITIGLSLRRFFILTALLDGHKTMTQLAAESNSSPAAMTGTRDALLKDGLVQSDSKSSAVEKGDRRTVMISITQKGREVVEEAKLLVAERGKKR